MIARLPGRCAGLPMPQRRTLASGHGHPLVDHPFRRPSCEAGAVGARWQSGPTLGAARAVAMILVAGRTIPRTHDRAPAPTAARNAQSRRHDAGALYARAFRADDAWWVGQPAAGGARGLLRGDCRRSTGGCRPSVAKPRGPLLGWHHQEGRAHAGIHSAAAAAKPGGGRSRRRPEPETFSPGEPAGPRGRLA